MRKPEIHALCKQLESELTDWKYIKTKTYFINKNHEFADKIIRYAWNSPYSGTVTSLPSIMFNVPEIAKTYKKYVGRDHSPFFLAHLNNFTPLKGSTYYIKSDHDYIDLDGARMGDQYAPQFIRDVFNHGEELLNRLYDFSSYDNFIKNIPADLNWKGWDKRPWPELTQEEKEYEKIQQIFQNGINFIYYGLLRMKLGDFDYIQNYDRDRNQIGPNAQKPLDLILKNIPEIKDTWERTGNLI